MDVTLMLAQIWGPLLFALGVGFFVSSSYYSKMYRDLEKDALAVLFVGMFAIVAGIVQVRMHNLWGTFPQIVISLLAWGTLAKGAVLTIMPSFAEKKADWVSRTKMVPMIGALMLIAGAYLSYLGYVA